MEFRISFEKNVFITNTFDTQWHWRSTYSCKKNYMQKVRNSATTGFALDRAAVEVEAVQL